LVTKVSEEVEILVLNLVFKLSIEEKRVLEITGHLFLHFEGPAGRDVLVIKRLPGGFEFMSKHHGVALESCLPKAP
jgi:hypothetical protein